MFIGFIPCGMYETLEIMGWKYQPQLVFAGFQPSTTYPFDFFGSSPTFRKGGAPFLRRGTRQAEPGGGVWFTIPAHGAEVKENWAKKSRISSPISSAEFLTIRGWYRGWKKHHDIVAKYIWLVRLIGDGILPVVYIGIIIITHERRIPSLTNQYVNGK